MSQAVVGFGDRGESAEGIGIGINDIIPFASECGDLNGVLVACGGGYANEPASCVECNEAPLASGCGFSEGNAELPCEFA